MRRYPVFLRSGRTIFVAFRVRTSLKIFFYRVLTQRDEAGFMDLLVLFIDSSYIKANANKRKFKKKLVRRVAQHYKDELDHVVNNNRILHAQQLFSLKTKSVEERQIKESDRSQEWLLREGEREKQFAYSCHTACDRDGFILGMIVIPGNVHNRLVFFHFFKPPRNTSRNHASSSTPPIRRSRLLQSS